ncbi:MAG TPA: riboflavin synthase [Pseudogracilibacillus sp.]|nr:riboflavin synthase [Pseudogracilibacillus sp.]
MFTGIVEEVGTIKAMSYTSEHAIEVTIEAEKVLTDVSIGDSIAVNGICLTVTSFTERTFQVDVMPETVKVTSLNEVKEGSIVNLERSLLPTDRFGGHFVTGHVDGIGEIVKKERDENAVYFYLHVPKTLMRYFILKGSIAVDGISLTIFGVDETNNIVNISIIPHTMDVTNLGKKTVGDIVNIECDMLAKHVHHYLAHVTENRF